MSMLGVRFSTLAPHRAGQIGFFNEGATWEVIQVATQLVNYKTGDPAFTVDRNGVIIVWNPAAEKEFGYSQNEAIGRRCWRLLGGRDDYGNRYCCQSCPLMEMAARNESVHCTEIEFKTANAGRKKVKLSCIVLSGYPGDGLLMHICHQPDNSTKAIENHTGNHSHNGNGNGNGNGNYQRATLTKRELQVLELLAEGNTTREIAAMMCVSEATVRNHIQHTMDKLHVHSRLEAVVVGQRLDLV